MRNSNKNTINSASIRHERAMENERMEKKTGRKKERKKEKRAIKRRAKLLLHPMQRLRPKWKLQVKLPLI